MHQQRGAEHDQQRGSGHHLARVGPGEQAEERVEQIAAGKHQRRDGEPGKPHRAHGFGERDLLLHRVARRQQWHQREQRHDRHVLEQEDRECALPVGLLQMAALLQDAQRNRGRRQRERQPRDQRTAPTEQACREPKPSDRRGGQHELRDAKPEDVAAHREQARQFEFEPDQEQQHHDAEFRHRDDGFGPREHAKPVRADHHARHQVGDDRRKPRKARDRHTDDDRGQQDEGEGEQADFGGMGIHGAWSGGQSSLLHDWRTRT